jgi:hypothetical protein
MERMHERPTTETKEMNARIPCDAEYDFVLVLDGLSEVSPSTEDALFEAGCDDCTISIRSGRVFLTFTRVARSVEAAIVTAIADVRRASIGAAVLRVDDCNLVTQAEISRKIGRTRQQVHQYITGERGPGGFPPPACHISDKAMLWRWCEVAHWLWESGIIKENALHEAMAIEAINSVLEFCHHKSSNPDLMTRLLSNLETECPAQN